MIGRKSLSGALMGALMLGSAISADIALGQAPNGNAQAGDKAAVGAVQDLARAFRNVGKEVEPSVVNIKVRKVIEPQDRRMPRGGPFDDPMFRHFFDRDGDGEPDVPGFGGPFGGGEQIGQGSGVIVALDGNTAYIVTNNHVAGEADEMTVVLNDGRTIENGELVGSDAKTDLAVIKIQADNLHAAKWGDSDTLEKGDWVMAFGSPFGYVGSMTHGIVSATNRTNMGIIPEGYESFIQIDAPINPGNSGGPLVNIHGEVVGINTAIASRTGGFQGIGFAIPSNQAKHIYQLLRDKGKVVRGWLGVKIASVSEEETAPIAKSFGYEGNKGVFVHQTFPDTPASGKLQEGDIITHINGKQIADATELRNAIAMLAPGTEVKLDVFREGKKQTATVKLGDQPANMTMAARGMGERGEKKDSANGTPKLGVVLSDMTPEIARQFNLPRTQTGAIITRIVPSSPAAKAGLNPGDIIVKVGSVTVNNADEAIAAIGKHDLAKGVRLYVTGPNGGRFVFVKASSDQGKRKPEREE